MPRLHLASLFTQILAIVPVWGAEPFTACDAVIYGATPGGIVTAVRAAREGLHVTLVHHHAHVGGAMSNGLGVFDTIYDGKRAPLLDEVMARVAEHYRAKYGAGSPQHLASTWPVRGTSGARPMFEPHVAERIFEDLLAAEKNITVLREFYPMAAARTGRAVTSVTFRRMNGTDTRTLSAATFVDASYEGDLAAVAGVAMTVGRESRAQYDESHAGRVFLKSKYVTDPKDYFPTAIRTEGLNLRGFRATNGELLPGSTGEGDAAVQAYNFRVCWTRDPENQRPPVSKPARYERDQYLALRDRWGIGGGQPNRKSSWNAPLLIGGNFDYPTGDWVTRRAIAERHRDLALGLLWFLQHDPEVPEQIRTEARHWSLPKDEFVDNGGFPWEMYVREARRLVGRAVFTQNDAMVAPGLGRAPIHGDSIAITEWPLDSHSCHLEVSSGSDHEGKVLLSEETRPGQISYACLLPKEVDNLLVTTCVSSTHVGWGTIRLEPTWMHIAESAAYALALARRERVLPADLPAPMLQRTLVSRGIMISFFNDFDMGSPSAAQRAAQVLGTRGFFPTYHARLDAPLTRAVAAVWATPDGDAMTTALRVSAAEKTAGASPVSAAEFAALTGREWPDAPKGPITRGAACEWLLAHGPDR